MSQPSEKRVTRSQREYRHMLPLAERKGEQIDPEQSGLENEPDFKKKELPSLPETSSHQLRGSSYGGGVGFQEGMQNYKLFTGGNFLAFFNNWKRKINPEWDDTDIAMGLFDVLSPEIQKAISLFECYPYGTEPDKEEFLKLLMELYPPSKHDEMLWEKKLQSIVQMYQQREFNLDQYINFYSLAVKKMEPMSTINMHYIIALFISVLPFTLKRDLEVRLVGKVHPTFSEVVAEVNGLTLDMFGNRHGNRIVSQFSSASHFVPRVITSENVKKNLIQKKETTPYGNSFPNERKYVPPIIQEKRMSSDSRAQCYYCGEGGHRKMDCEVLPKDVANKLIYFNDRGEICLCGTNERIYSNRNRSMREFILQKTSRSGAPIQSVSIQRESEEYETDDEKQEISCNVGQETQKGDNNAPKVGYQKSRTVEIKEEKEKEIAQKIGEEVISLPLKTLLGHPGIAQAVRNQYSQNNNRDIGKPKPVGNKVSNITCAECRYIRLNINGQPSIAMLDSGSAVNLMTSWKAASLGLQLEKNDNHLIAVNKTRLRLVGVVPNVSVSINNVCNTLYFHIVEHIAEDVLLGQPFERSFFFQSRNLPDGMYEASVSNEEGERENLEILKTRPKYNQNRENIIAAVRVMHGPNAIHFLKNFFHEKKPLCKNQSDSGKNVVMTIHKKVHEKVKPVSVYLPKEKKESSALNQEKKFFIAKQRILTPEKIKEIQIGDLFTIREKEELISMLYTVQDALGFDVGDLGSLSPHIEGPIVIQTVPHKPWEEKPMRFSLEMRNALTEYIHSRIQSGLLEHSSGPYSNKYFLVKKKDNSFRFIMDVRPLNNVSIRDCNLPPIIEDIIENLSGYPVYSTMDALSGYDQIPLSEDSRDLTSIWTPIGLLRSTVLPQGYTNSVAIFERVMSKILGPLKGQGIENMIDDVVVTAKNREKDPTLMENGCRKFIFDHILLLKDFLLRFKEANLVINMKKTFLGFEEILLLGVKVSSSGHFPDEKRIEKIASWKCPRTIKELRGFLALCAGVQMFFPMMGELTGPLSDCLKGGRKESKELVQWTEEARTSFTSLKTCISKFVTLHHPHILKHEKYIVYTDAGEYAAGIVLTIFDTQTSQERPIRFDSKVFNSAQRLYSTPRKELLAVLFGLRKVKRIVLGHEILIRTDSKIVYYLLLNPGDSPDFMLTRWASACKEFVFNVEFIPREQNVLADALTRLGVYFDFNSNETPDEDLDFLISQVNLEEIPNISHYSTRNQDVIKYITRGTRPDSMNNKEFGFFKTIASHFRWDAKLWFMGAGKILREVIDDATQQQQILLQMHQESGHRGGKSLYYLLKQRVYWENLKKDVKQFIKNCELCQLFDRSQQESSFGFRPIQDIMTEVAIDHLKIHGKSAYPYLLVARCTFSGWIEAVPTKDTKAIHVVNFLKKEIISRYGLIQTIIADSGTVSAQEVKEYLNSIGVRLQVTLSQNPTGNAVVERGHRPILAMLQKLAHPHPNKWQEKLHEVLWADRVCYRNPLGASPYFLLFGKMPVLRIDMKTLHWMDQFSVAENLSPEELLEFRFQQINKLEFCRENSKHQVEESREISRSLTLMDKVDRGKPGELVLVYSKTKENTYAFKMEPLWSGPFRLTKLEGNLAYLQDLNGVDFHRPISVHRIKKFFGDKSPENSDLQQVFFVEVFQNFSFSHSLFPKQNFHFFFFCKLFFLTYFFLFFKMESINHQEFRTPLREDVKTLMKAQNFESPSELEICAVQGLMKQRYAKLIRSVKKTPSRSVPLPFCSSPLSKIRSINENILKKTPQKKEKNLKTPKKKGKKTSRKRIDFTLVKQFIALAKKIEKDYDLDDVEMSSEEEETEEKKPEKNENNLKKNLEKNSEKKELKRFLLDKVEIPKRETLFTSPSTSFFCHDHSGEREKVQSPPLAELLLPAKNIPKSKEMHQEINLANYEINQELYDQIMVICKGNQDGGSFDDFFNRDVKSALTNNPGVVKTFLRMCQAIPIPFYAFIHQNPKKFTIPIKKAQSILNKVYRVPLPPAVFVPHFTLETLMSYCQAHIPFQKSRKESESFYVVVIANYHLYVALLKVEPRLASNPLLFRYFCTLDFEIRQSYFHSPKFFIDFK